MERHNAHDDIVLRSIAHALNQLSWLQALAFQCQRYQAIIQGDYPGPWAHSTPMLPQHIRHGHLIQHGSLHTLKLPAGMAAYASAGAMAARKSPVLWLTWYELSGWNK